MDEQHAPFPLGHGSYTATIKDGRTVVIRHISAEDDDLLVVLYHQLSPETRRLRFLTDRPNLPDELIWKEAIRLSHIDPLAEAALIAVVPHAGTEQAIGVARLAREREDAGVAEFAIVIRDDYQRGGLGTLLFDLLLQVAMVRGLRQLRGLSLAENQGILRLIRRSGLPFSTHTSRGETTTLISLLDT